MNPSLLIEIVNRAQANKALAGPSEEDWKRTLADTDLLIREIVMLREIAKFFLKFSPPPPNVLPEQAGLTIEHMLMIMNLTIEVELGSAQPAIPAIPQPKGGLTP